MLPFCLTIYLLPILNFVQFLRLASRLIKVKYNHCDDDITEMCMSARSSPQTRPIDCRTLSNRQTLSSPPPSSFWDGQVRRGTLLAVRV